jgi:hypothetical protein
VLSLGSGCSSADVAQEQEGTEPAEDAATLVETAPPVVPPASEAPEVTRLDGWAARTLHGSKRVPAPVVVVRTSGPVLDADATRELSEAGKHRGMIRHVSSDGRTTNFEVTATGSVAVGDIIVGTAADLPTLVQTAEMHPLSVGLSNSGSEPLWPNRTVPYTIDSGITGPHFQALIQAIGSWNVLSPNVKFMSTAGATHSVRFVEGDLANACAASGVGYSPNAGTQTITIDSGCFNTRTIQHEMGHVVGLHHEQQRCHRSDFVSVHNDSSGAPPPSDYQELCNSHTQNYGPYDYGSVMHYTPDGFMDVVASPTGDFVSAPFFAGMGSRLSQDDVNGIDELYTRKVFSTTTGGGFAWADQATTASYDAHSGYAYNSADTSTGPRAHITRSSTGKYRVEFKKLNSEVGGNVQVTAYGQGATRCNVEQWVGTSAIVGTGTTLQVSVGCWGPGGVPADSQFVVSYQRLKSPTTSLTGGYLLSNRLQEVGKYTPPLWYQANAAGKRDFVVATNTGAYGANFPGVNITGGTVRLTSYGTSGTYCNVRNWAPETVVIDCFGPDGAHQDSAFTVDFTTDGFTGTFAFAWANEPQSSNYVPDLSYQRSALFTASGAVDNPTPITVARQGTGDWLVDIPGVPDGGAAGKTNVSVVAYGSNAQCKVAGWYPLAAVGPNLADRRERVSVHCFAPDGTPIDTRYVVTFMSNEVLL